MGFLIFIKSQYHKAYNLIKKFDIIMDFIFHLSN